MSNAFDSRIYARMLEASKTHKSLAAALDQDNRKADINRELALLLQKKGMNPDAALTAARTAELEKQTGIPISAAIERGKMYMGSRTRQCNTIGNYF
jgi:hypothetical protein